MKNLKFLEAHHVICISKESPTIQIYENECSRVILSALAPFLCVYYQLAVTLNEVILLIKKKKLSFSCMNILF